MPTPVYSITGNSVTSGGIGIVSYGSLTSDFEDLQENETIENNINSKKVKFKNLFLEFNLNKTGPPRAQDLNLMYFNFSIEKTDLQLRNSRTRHILKHVLK